MRRLLFIALSGLIGGGVLVCAPTAGAAPVPQPCGRYYCSCDDVFRTPTELDAWTTASPVVIGPYGRQHIYCHVEPLVFDAWQVAPDGQEHQLYSVQSLSTLSMSKLYVWNPNVVPGRHN
ncbi:hypothetical protein [Nocardia sp. NPDC050412]|uniref:hypothetical protein n=1 Tax=unclassified Nocardia TaxID=2637762 RepID=UPI0037AFB012